MSDPESEAGEPLGRPTGWLPPQAPQPRPPQPPARRPWPRVPTFPSPPGLAPGADRATSGPRRRRSRRRNWLTLVPLALLTPLVGLMVLVLVVTAATRGQGEPEARPPASTSLPTREPDVVWSLEPGQLRPDLPQAEFLSALDGSSDGSQVTGVGGLWLAATASKGSKNGADAVLHGLDPATGAPRWQRRLDGVLCATEAPADGLLCASVLGRDARTGLGIRWRLHLLDPATGRDRATRDVDAWITAVHWSRGSFVLLEQRQPAPHAVVRAFRSTDLRPRWTRDLAGEKGQAEMFSRNRIVGRLEPDRPGLALDRPHFRDVGKGLVAVWAGGRTAFVDAADGKLEMMPHCSRLVDDGDRLWCNEVDGVSAYRYDGRKLFRVRGPRLAFPESDLTGPDQDRPVFLDEDGAAVAVDPRTGAVGAAYTPPGRGSAFGLVTMPSAYTVGARTFVIGDAGAMLLVRGRDRVQWRNEDITVSDLPLVVGGQVLLGASRLDVVDLATGETTAQLRSGSSTLAVGDRIAVAGSRVISLIRV